jgi:hypothetical protein
MFRPAEGAPTEVWAHPSDDGGKTFTSRSLVSRKLSPGLGYAQLAAGGTGGDSVLVFVRALGPPHAPGGVWLNRSVDGGRSWSEELRVDRFPGSGGGGAQAPSAAFTPDGVLGVSWVDSGGDPEGRTRRLHFSWSTDGGRTFAAPIALAERGADPFTDENGATGRLLSAGGHYLGLAALPTGDFQALWSDSRDGLFALYTARIAPKRADSRPSGSPRQR